MLVFISPRFVISDCCLKEVNLADLLRLPIIPVMIDKTPWPPPGSLAIILSQHIYIDLAGTGGHGGCGRDAAAEGQHVASAVVLQQMQKSTQCGLLHFYWFGQRHLGLDFGIPDNCLLAYEEWMEEEKLKIVGGVELLFERLCLKPDEATTPKDAGIGLAETLDQSFQDMRQILDKKREFKVMIVTIHSQIKC